MKHSTNSIEHLSNNSIRMQSPYIMNPTSNNSIQEAVKPESTKIQQENAFKSNLEAHMQRPSGVQEPFNHDYMAYG
jgi:hypothetical protein